MSVSDAMPEEEQSSRKTRWERYAYHILAGTAVFVMALGTVAYHFLDGGSWVDSFYFSAVAGSTVGFGDLTPTTDGSKLFTVFYIFSSIAILGTFLNERMKHHGVVKRRTEHMVKSAKADQAGAADKTD